MRKNFPSDSLVLQVHSAQGRSLVGSRGFSFALLAATLLSGVAGGQALAAEAQHSGKAVKHTARAVVPHKAAGQAAAPPASGTVSVGAAHGSASSSPATRSANLRTVRGAVVAPGPVAAEGEESVVVTGTREAGGRKARESLSPIDVVSAKQLSQTGQPNLREALAQLLPSLTMPTGGFDSGALTDSISLRGLNPNETLVLVDGKRRHTTANIYADPGPQQGSTAVDIDMIPMAAIDHVEVLRDGASAQYGSDAVAGVVNIILKKQDHGFHAESISGITAAKDGFQQGVYLDGGAKLGDRGFVHVSGDFYHTDHTFRSAPDARTGQKNNYVLGQPEQTRESVAINAGYDLTNSIQLYATGTYAHRHAESFQNFRLGSSLAKYPGYAAIYPWGYSPVETNEENDFGITVGVKGKLIGWNWDLSTVYGRDFDSIGLNNSANLSLEKDTGRTPTHFDVQGFNNSQWSNNFDLSRKFKLSGWPHAINVAGGASYRYESYSIGTGSADSLYGGGSDAMAGTNAGNAGNFSRDVVAGYVDVSTNLTRHWQLDLAGRYEHYTDVGDTETGKVSTRYEVSPRLAFRATISSGFHAPTLAQEHYSALAISPTAARGLIAVNSPGALANGASPLKSERSTNASGGIVMEPFHKLHVTVDVYQINLRDQIMPGGQVYGDQARSALQMNGFSLPDGSGAWAPASLSTHWFANVASTRTQGLDLTATYPTQLGDIGRIDWDVAINLNRTRLSHQGTDAQGNPLMNAQSVAYLTTAYPRSKMIFGGRFTSGKWTVGVHEIRYGQTTSQLTYYGGAGNTNSLSSTQFREFHNTPKFITNLEVTYRVHPRLALTLGGNNMFDARPSRVPDNNRYLGAPQYYMSTSQLGMNGGFYYLRGDVNF
ncbi:TonB-dependent receptor plug domain-containing protein [Acetobacter orleanensis]|uniref:TonB-dependent receptor plug domain-containing protein n=1 Tax=Acetobacter orleanensis TaxID=104099 RepID=UPI0005E41109|nr:TonB-dependent receptor [Acetobacter orleanensis]GAN68622.1 TonB-dependent outer membrane siderophore receptor [Acetobacter orleanensis JCM 7639]GBR27761.1 TonB-dependent outer membrane receptor [Acetobacter orleanensis NRIC 0473]